jgi:hypothetical protein
MGYLVLGIILLVASVFFLKWYANAPPQSIIRVLKWGGITLAVIGGMLFLLRGGAQFSWIAGAFLLPWLMRAWGMRNFARASRSRAGGQKSTVRTSFVLMELDHDTGEMDGDILKGQYVGRRLSDLDFESLIDLLNVAKSEDEQSAQVLESYLDRMHSDEWRKRANSSGGATYEQAARTSSGLMSREEAFEVLGLGDHASEKEIKAAHRRLIREYHPDRGGSDYLAAKINEAKDLLLKD